MKVTRIESVVLIVTLLFIAVLCGYAAGSGGDSDDRGYFVKTAKAAESTDIMTGGDAESRAKESAAPSEINALVQAKFPININSADVGGLILLPGIGEALAGRIISYREENGGFEAAEDIMKVRGIGEKTFEQLRELITVEADSESSGEIKEKDDNENTGR